MTVVKAHHHGAAGRHDRARKFKHPGGRPKNAWTSSRRRKAVRLYLFTNLRMEHIISVLRGDGFSPGKRNVETNIFSLLPNLPKDYARTKRVDHAKLVSQWRQISQLRRRRSLKPGHILSAVQNTDSKSRVLPNQSVDPTDLPFPLQQIVILQPSENEPDSEEKPKLSRTPNISLTSVLEIHTQSQLRARLGTNYSSAEIEHIFSVLNSSKASSQRSSLLSYTTSLGSSRTESILDSVMEIESSTANPRALFRRLKKKMPFQNTLSKTDIFSEEERNLLDVLLDSTIWDDLESDPPTFPGPFFSKRHCCGSSRQNRMPTLPCHKCGFQEAHRVAAIISFTNASVAFELVRDLNEKDYFNNTCLHFAASSPTVSIPSLVNMLQCRNVDINAKNNMGETFMHVLGARWNHDNFSFEKSKRLPLENVYEKMCYGELLMLLRTKGFQFSVRDYRGRSIGDVLSRDMESLMLVFGPVKNALNILGTELFIAMDNLGHTTSLKQALYHYVKDYSEREPHSLKWAPSEEINLEWILEDLHQQLDPTIEFAILFQNGFNQVDPKNLQLCELHASWVDINGDTMLIAGMKCLADADAASVCQILLSFGAEVNAQNRRGNTSLGFAASRGLREATRILLQKGANPNARNYSDVSVLRRAGKCMVLATSACLYASILFCQSLLTEYGAIQEPDTWLEWSSHDKRPQATEKERRAAEEAVKKPHQKQTARIQRILEVGSETG